SHRAPFTRVYQTSWHTTGQLRARAEAREGDSATMNSICVTQTLLHTRERLSLVGTRILLTQRSGIVSFQHRREVIPSTLQKVDHAVEFGTTILRKQFLHVGL